MARPAAHQASVRQSVSHLLRPIYLEAWSAARIATVRPLVRHADATSATLEVHIDLDTAHTDAEDAGEVLELVCTLLGPEGNRVAEATALTSGMEGPVVLEVLDPQLWWPRGHGAQPLYTLEVTLLRQGRPLDTRKERTGLRTVRLDTQKDDTGSRFVVRINGKAIFCKGANWIPDDCFPTRVSERRYRERLEQACGAHMNMLRVWGGGIYETETFYSLCDELGILVWQDFPFACAAYPEEAPFWQEVEAEARYQVTRLSAHPSLVLWNGNNENIWGYFDWGWHARLEGRTWGKGYYLDLLPGIVAELDSSRPYWPGSPYSGSFDLHPNDDRYGPKHIWDVWNEKDYLVYRHYRPRFASEFGFQGPPTPATIHRAIPENQHAPDSPAMLHHQKAIGGNDKLHARLAEHFTVPEAFDAWHYATQLNQARAVGLGVEWFRSLQPRCMGTLYWQLNDCWPVTSWAAVDGDGRPKLLWYATRRFFADRLLTIQPRGGKLVLFASNDSDLPWQGRIAFFRLSFGGEVYARDEAALDVPARTTAAVLELGAQLSRAQNPRQEMIAVRSDQGTATWFFARDKELGYPEPSFDATLQGEGSSYALTLRARTLLRDVCLFLDWLDPQASVSDQLVTLLPGESFTFEIRSNRPLHKDLLLSSPVFQCANALGGSSKS